MNKAFDPLTQPATSQAVDRAEPSDRDAPSGDDRAGSIVPDTEAELRVCLAELDACRAELSRAQSEVAAAQARATLLATARDVAVIAARRATADPAAGEWRRQIARLQQRAHAAEAQCRNWQQQVAGAEAATAVLRTELLAAEQRYANLRDRLGQLLRRFGGAVRLVPKPVRHFARSRIVKWSHH